MVTSSRPSASLVLWIKRPSDNRCHRPIIYQNQLKWDIVQKTRSHCLSTNKGIELFTSGWRSHQDQAVDGYTWMNRLSSTHVCQFSESMSAPSSPISITFESCWPAQSWQRSCPVRAHSASGYLTTLDCLPCPTQQCIAFFFWYKNPFFAASLRF